MKDFWRAIKFAAVNRALTFSTIGMIVVGVILNIWQPYVLKLIIDVVQNSAKIGRFDSQGFFGVALIYALLSLFRDILNQYEEYFINKWFEWTFFKLSTKAFEHLEELSVGYFSQNSAGKIKERIDSGVSNLSAIMFSVFMEIIPQLLFMTIAGFVLIKINFLFGAAIIIGAPLFFIISIFLSKRNIALHDLIRDKKEHAAAIAIESIANIRTIKSYTGEEFQRRKHANSLRDSATLNIRYYFIRLLMNIYRAFILNLSQVFVLLFGAYLAANGKITIGTLVLAISYAQQSFNPLWYISRLYDEAQRQMRSVRRLFEFIDTKPEIVDANNAVNLKVTNGEIAIKDVVFKYDKKDRNLLKNLDLVIPPKSKVAVIGKSGVGKSTLTKLILRFSDPDSGCILIDGVDIRTVTQKSLRKNIGMVMQDALLFNDTALNNIRFGSPAKTRDDVIRAAKMANADQFITKLKNGYDTVVGERGVRLSGGEQQRINIARAFLKDAPILILDEATSSLDSESERNIQDSLEKLSSGKTTIIIAHRLSTVMRADLIVVMDKGKISEIGTHKDLVAKKGIYAKLFEIQSGGYLK